MRRYVLFPLCLIALMLVSSLEARAVDREVVASRVDDAQRDVQKRVIVHRRRIARSTDSESDSEDQGVQHGRIARSIGSDTDSEDQGVQHGRIARSIGSDTDSEDQGGPFFYDFGAK